MTINYILSSIIRRLRSKLALHCERRLSTKNISLEASLKKLLETNNGEQKSMQRATKASVNRPWLHWVDN